MYWIAALVMLEEVEEEEGEEAFDIVTGYSLGEVASQTIVR